MPLTNGKIPTFYLYGEPHRRVDERFIHVESLDDRSRPSEWTIRPHAHAELNHLFHIGTGGGTMRAEARAVSFVAPCLLVVPAGVAHGFTWEAESRGSVVTLATTYLHEIHRRDPDLDALFRTVAVVPLATEDRGVVNAAVQRLMQELSWAAPGHRAAADAGLLALMVIAFRLLGPALENATPLPGHHAALVARFRERIEQRFRLREPIPSHAKALGVSLAQLRSACARVARQAPSEVLDQRAVLEAKRVLIYSNLSITDIADSLGFADPAYFSRFFARHVGKSPRAFRKDQEATSANDTGLRMPSAPADRLSR